MMPHLPHFSPRNRSLLGTAPLLAAASLLITGCSDGADAQENNGDQVMLDSMSGGASGGAFEAPGSGGLGTSEDFGSGGMTSTGGSPDETGGETGSGGGPSEDRLAFAAGLDGLFMDRPCAFGTSLPLADGAVRDHRDNLLHAEQIVTFGGDSGVAYAVTLRVRGIWEPTNIDGGETPNAEVPFTIGGEISPGTGSDSDAINYQQFSVVVGSPAQTYWLNNHDYVAHDIHQEDYEVVLLIEGGSSVTVIANDGNGREIANYPQVSFPDTPPYDVTPTLGQFVRLDVISVEAAP